MDQFMTSHILEGFAAKQRVVVPTTCTKHHVVHLAPIYGAKQRVVHVARTKQRVVHTARTFTTSGATSQHVVHRFVNIDDKRKLAIIVLNDSQSLNAMTVAMGENFESTVERLNELGDDICAVIVTGSGRAFSSGGDLSFIQARQHATHTENTQEMRRFYDRFLSIRSVQVPTIAAINGAAVGAGLCLALACDMRIASVNAKLGATFVKLGIHPGMGATHYLPQIVGHERAQRMLLTGELISANDAASMGLISEVVQDENVTECAKSLASKISRSPSIAVRGTLRTLRMQQDEGLDRALWREAAQQAACYANSEHHEAIRALNEKVRRRRDK